MQHVEGRPTKLPLDIDVDIVHRPGAIERDQGGDLFNGATPHLAQRVAHALAFQLEHADGLARGQQRIGALIIKRQGIEIDIGATFGQMLDRPIQDGERLQAKEVKLHQARALHPFHIILGGGKF